MNFIEVTEPFADGDQRKILINFNAVYEIIPSNNKTGAVLRTATEKIYIKESIDEVADLIRKKELEKR